MDEQQGQQEDPKLTKYRILKSRGFARPLDCPPDMWAQASPVTEQGALQVMQAQLAHATVEQAKQDLPKDEKAVMRRYFMPAVAVRAEIMMDPEVKPSDRLQASQTFLEYTLGKPEQKVEHSGSLAMEIFTSIEQLAKDLRSGTIIDTENLLPKTSPVIEAFIKKHAPQKLVVGKKAALDVKQESEPEPGEGLPGRTGEEF